MKLRILKSNTLLIVGRGPRIAGREEKRPAFEALLYVRCQGGNRKTVAGLSGLSLPKTVGPVVARPDGVRQVGGFPTGSLYLGKSAFLLPNQGANRRFG